MSSASTTKTIIGLYNLKCFKPFYAEAEEIIPHDFYTIQILEKNDIRMVRKIRRVESLNLFIHWSVNCMMGIASPCISKPTTT